MELVISVTYTVGYTLPGWSGQCRNCVLPDSGPTTGSPKHCTRILCTHSDPAFQWVTWKTVGVDPAGGWHFGPAGLGCQYPECALTRQIYQAMMSQLAVVRERP